MSILFPVSLCHLLHLFPDTIDHIAFQNPNTQVTGSQGQQSTGFHSQNFANQQPSWQSMSSFLELMSHRSSTSDPQTLPTQQQPSWQSMSSFSELMSHRSCSSDLKLFQLNNNHHGKVCLPF